MSALRRFLTRFFNTALGRRDEERLREEIDEHLALLTDENLRAGLSPREARRQAMLTFGGIEAVKEEYRGERRMLSIEGLMQDVRYALRMMRKSPGFTLVVVLIIALGVGATTAIFSVVDATLLHPLPYPRAEQLVSVEDDLPGVPAQDVGLSQPELYDLEHSGIFEHVSPAWYDDNNLTGSSQPARVRLILVAPSYFAMLGVKPQLGRTFDPENDAPGIIPEVVISDGLWKRAFAGDPQVLGKNIRMDTDLYQVVGIMPPGFNNPGRTIQERNAEIWAATSFYGPPLLDHPSRAARNLPGAIARLKSGLTMEAAQSKLDALVASLRKQFPEDYPVQSGWTVKLAPLKENVVGNVRPTLILLLSAVLLVLLIGCADVANLLLARASARGREMAMRQALGAPRSRLIQQLLTESLLLSLLGGLAGLALLFAVKGFLLQALPETLPRLNQISINWSVLLFALGTSMVAGVIFGLAPAWQAGKLDLISALKQEGRSSSGSGKQRRTRHLLVVTEFALSLVLMISACLLLRSFWDLLNVRLGFNPQSVMAVRTRLPYPNNTKIDLYPTIAEEAPFVRELVRRARTLPGVEEVALGNNTSIPLDHAQRDQNISPVTFEGRDTEANQAVLIDNSIVTSDYFHLLGMTLLRGRFFTDLDNEKMPAVAVVNEAMAKTYWPNQDPLGQHLKISRRATDWTTVVGVVADSRTESLAEASVPQIYLSLYQTPAKHLTFFLRGQLDAAAIPEQVRAQVQAVDPTLPVFDARTLNETVSASLAQRRFSMQMVASFGLTALLLAALGIYGVISYTVGERTHEIGIRLALGAHRGDVMRLVLRQGLNLAIAGTAAGLISALIVSHLITGLLYGVRPTDPATFAGVAIILMIVALLACYFPARRAMRVDPLIALRYE